MIINEHVPEPTLRDLLCECKDKGLDCNRKIAKYRIPSHWMAKPIAVDSIPDDGAFIRLICKRCGGVMLLELST
jgi:hypothetical protein